VATTALLPLEHLHRDEWGEVVEVSGEPGWVSRLAEHGLRPGVLVHMLQNGSPCLFRLGQSRLSLRTEEFGQVLVIPIAEPCCCSAEVA
jgi:Fe2+ transport system protein FeoA